MKLNISTTFHLLWNREFKQLCLIPTLILVKGSGYWNIGFTFLFFDAAIFFNQASHEQTKIFGDEPFEEVQVTSVPEKQISDLND